MVLGRKAKTEEKPQALAWCIITPSENKHTIGTINVTVHHFPALNRNLVIGSRAIKFLAEVRGVQTSVNNLKPNLR